MFLNMPTFENTKRESSCGYLFDNSQDQGRVNLCVSGIMSMCGAGPGLKAQRACRFFKKSSFAERCMHFSVAVPGHCDCVDAQRAQKGIGESDRRGR